MDTGKLRALWGAARRAKRVVDETAAETRGVVNGSGAAERTGNEDVGDGAAVRCRVRPPAKESRSLKLATLVTAIGAVMWIFAAVSAQKPEAQGLSGSAAGVVEHEPAKHRTWGEEGMPASLTPVEGLGAAVAAGGAEGTNDERRLVDKAAPWTFRIGLSFMVGFFVAWAARKFLKVTILIGGAVGLLVLILKQTGVVSLDWGAVEGQVSQGVEFATREASRYREALMAMAPSGAAGVVGAFFGFRHD